MVAFYIRNSKITNADLIRIILIAVEQLYWQGGPDVLERIKSLIFGHSGRHRG
jgi:hypothetical protein